MKRLIRWVLAIPLALIALLGLVLVGDALHREEKVPSDPVVRPSAIDRWAPPWGAAMVETVAASGPPRRWVVIGWDGASWDLILPMIERGKLPHLSGLMQRGAYGALLTFRPTFSPTLWTTVATGMRPEVHGIRGFEVPRTKLQKRIERLTHGGKLKRRLYQNTDRRVRSLWNLLSDAGRPVLIVGYHNTYPAEEVRGLMVSNYLMQDLLSGMMHAANGVDPELAETLVHPVAELPAVLQLETATRAGFRAAIPRFADIDRAQSDALVTLSGVDADTRHRLFWLRQAYLPDTFDAEVVAAYFDRLEPDLTMVHFQAIDIAGHYYLYFGHPELYRQVAFTAGDREKLDADVPSYARTLEAFHEYLDEWLGKLLATIPPDVGVMVVSDHGMDAEANEHRPGGHVEAPPGIIVMAGPGVRAGARLTHASLYDVFPTLAASLGLPLSAELPGHPLEAAFAPGAFEATGIRTVATYETSERYVPRVAPPAALDHELEQQLKSLGYIK